MSKVRNYDRDIGQQTHPTDTRLCPGTLHWDSSLIGVKQVRKIHTGHTAKPMKAPSSGIYIKQFVLVIARILLELNLDKAVKVDRPKKTFGQLFDFWKVHCLNIGSGATKFPGMLA